MTLKEIRSKISGIRSQVEELATEAYDLWEQGQEAAGDLEDALEDIAAALAEQEGEADE